MLSIEWIRHRGPGEPPVVVETMPFVGGVADAVAHARSVFAETQERLPLNPPDGFRIVDESGQQRAQWFTNDDQHA